MGRDAIRRIAGLEYYQCMTIAELRRRTRADLLLTGARAAKRWKQLPLPTVLDAGVGCPLFGECA